MTTYKIRPLEWRQGPCHYFADAGDYECIVWQYAANWSWDLLVKSEGVASGKSDTLPEAKAAVEACYQRAISEHLEPVENNP